MTESKVYVFDKNCKHCRDREGHIAKTNTLQTKYRVRCEGCGYIHYVKKELFEDMMNLRGDKPIEPKPAKRIKEYGSFVSMFGHNLHSAEINSLMKIAVGSYLETMVENNLPLTQKVEINIQEVMRTDELTASPDLLPFTLVSWKMKVEVDHV